MAVERTAKESVSSDYRSSTSSRQSSRFMLVDFTKDEIAHKAFNLHQNPPAQDFYQLKERYLSEGTYFEDPDFPPSHQSLTKRQSKPDVTIRWLRPREICRKPRFLVDGASRFDVRQGNLHDCWLLAAIANLTSNQRLFQKTVPLDNSFADEEYVGIFHFRFWQFGQWVDVVIDDRLPTRDKELIFMRSSEKNEFWSALLEKAYAKLHGSYEALNSGTSREAMQDFTGGITEWYRLGGQIPAPPENLFDIIHSGLLRGSMFACSISADPEHPEAFTPQGLVKGHSYSLTKAHILDDSETKLIRLRNPWGDDIEWNGAWSDRSDVWDDIPKEERKRIGLTLDHDGEFWMDFNDFLRYFSRVEICNLSPESPDLPEEIQRGWQVSTIDGEWVKGSTAGGCDGNYESFAMNPQYVVRLDEPDLEDTMCTIVIAIMQKYRRADDLQYLTIGFVVYQVTDEDLRNKPLPREFFEKNNDRMEYQAIFINARELSCRLRLKPGRYLIVPATFEPGQEGEFLIRIFSEMRNCLEENDCTVCFGTMDDRVAGPLLENGDWEQMVRSFYDVADRRGEIDSIALSAMLNQHFFAPTTLHRKRLSIWKRLSLRLRHVLVCCWIAPLRPKSRTDNLTNANQSLVQRISKLLIGRVNPGKSPKLNYDQFRTVVRDVQQWQVVFDLYDLDHSGHLDRKELKKALNSSGFNVNNRVLHELMRRSNERDVTQMDLTVFVFCAVESRNAIEKLQQNIVTGSNAIITDIRAK
ncbi:calpain-B-like [Toxorhynchites rutilus septentrionalis]|uniref:calpain-B-like n=1 Tax=Toxorhynchites rutilus septentrionalis TaxID=329112 RepID=UPI0024785177|nr:calpain-B-like [Toxorhynchites rutilus septentrionalis]XP_055629030.1 calpain-B-like [Toxorhynchites rutilus septentrionalis]